ncbi:MAG TPA: hypothetical protein VF836_11825 [Gemmatimonadaceae bacterium]
MAPSPYRPFVPHRTPKTARPVTGASEFRLARPFVPGAEHSVVEIPQGETTTAARVEPAARLQPIQDFLDLSVPASAPDSRGEDFSSDLNEDPDELPPLEHFLDPLPRVGEFAPGSSHGFDATATAAHEDAGVSAPPSDSLASEWANADWAQYDWRSVAALGETGESAASSAWATTDWDGTGPRAARAAKDARPTAAQAIASALDQIAQRIRDGDLAVPMPGGGTDPATIAATLAALLGIRT